MSQNLNPSTCSSLVIFLYWACDKHASNETPTEKLQQHLLVFAMNRTYCTSFLWRLYLVHHLHILVKAPLGCDIGKAEQQVCKAINCRTKQPQRSHVVLILFLLVRATCVVFFMHMPFVMNRSFTTRLTEKLQHFAARLDSWNDW